MDLSCCCGLIAANSEVPRLGTLGEKPQFGKKVDKKQFLIKDVASVHPTHASLCAVWPVRPGSTDFLSGDVSRLSCWSIAVFALSLNPCRLDFSLLGASQIWLWDCGAGTSRVYSNVTILVLVVLVLLVVLVVILVLLGLGWKVNRSWWETWKTFALTRLLTMWFIYFFPSLSAPDLGGGRDAK